MKNIILIFLVLFTKLGFAQNYSFNLLTDYYTTGSNYFGPYDRHTISYSNTKDSGYLLILDKFKSGNFAFIRDTRTNKCHHFTFTESLEGKETMFEFYYTATYDHGYKPHDCICSQVVTQKDSATQILNISYFENRRKMRKNKPHSKAELTILKNDVDLFPLYQRLFISAHDANLPLDNSIKGIVRSSVSRGKNIYSRRLVYIKNVDFKISIEKQKIPQISGNEKWKRDY